VKENLEVPVKEPSLICAVKPYVPEVVPLGSTITAISLL
jgi:hypothetical protein